MTTIQWNDSCPNCTGTNGEEPESLIRLIEYSVPHVFPDACWYCENRERNVITSGDYLHLLRQRSHGKIDHAGISIERDDEFLLGLGVENVKATDVLSKFLSRIPPPGKETEQYLRCYLSSGYPAYLADPDLIVPRPKSAMAMKESLTLGLCRKIVGIKPSETQPRIEVILNFRAVVYCYRMDTFILKSRLVENKVQASVYQVDTDEPAKSNEKKQPQLLSTYQRVFVYE